ncbi:response regulator [Pelagibius sp. Alg239-R121]|uniref:response regulator n=1 Tax=Pelagibius sp. Alg239-R121 TaxID=2993448 RepID=UPI0024A731BE|nr:response regulator [Pelagibius sp. Alg239-R121]
MAQILIVDDEILICEMLYALLTGAGHKAVTAPDGAEAIKVIKEHSIDLVIADIVMPEKDGLELIIEIRKTAPDLRTIAISGASRISNVHFLDLAKGCGASEALHKPIRNDLLLEAVERCLAA